MTSRFEDQLNRSLDRRVVWGRTWRGGVIPYFRFWAVIGLFAAVTIALAVAYVRNVSVVWLSTAIAAAFLSCLVLALGYKVTAGEERLVFLHHVAVAVGTAALTLSFSGEPILPAVEILVVCFGVLLAIGRWGCLCAGCCHGRPHDWGVRYGRAYVKEGFPSSLSGVRLLPVQLVESAWTGTASIAGVTALLAGAPAGLTLAYFLPVYAIGRFGCEFLRGDADRTWWRAFSEAQWICVGLAAVSVISQATGLLPGNFGSVLVGAAVCTVMLGALASTRFRDWAQPFHPSDVGEIADAVRSREDSDQVVVRSTARGWRFSRGSIDASEGDCLHWAISGLPDDPRWRNSLAVLLLRLEGLPRNTPVRVEDARPVMHVLAFPADGPT